MTGGGPPAGGGHGAVHGPGDANPEAALDDICALLRSGKDVISTAVTPLIHPASMGQEVVDRLEQACAAGRSTFHGTGIQPGWASEVLPLLLSGIVRSIDSLLVREVLEYSSYDNALMLFDVMGFGRVPDDPTVLGADPSILAGVFRAPLLLVADGLGAHIEEFLFDRDVRPRRSPSTSRRDASRSAPSPRCASRPPP